MCSSDLIHATAVSKGWWNGTCNQYEKIALMNSELSEAIEFLRQGDNYSDHIPDFKGVEEEFADVIIRILDYAEAFGLDIPEAVLAKIKFNENRRYRHGGKKA